MFPFLAWPGTRRWGRVVRPVFPQLPGSAVWRFLLEKHSWDWQAALVSGLIYACVPPLTDLGSQGEKNLRTVPELDQMALSHVPSPGYLENWGRILDMIFTLVGRSSTSKSEEESSFAPLLPFPARLLHHLNLFFLLCFPSYTYQSSDFPPLPAPHMQFSSKLSLKRLTFLKNVQILQLFLFCLA